jgi:NitT/TauT family transport system substrate-binding protein
MLGDLTTLEGVKKNFDSEIYPGAVLISTTAWLQNNPTIARHLAKAVQRSLHWCHQHTAREIADKMPSAFRLQDRAIYEEAVAHTVAILSPDGLMPIEAVEAEKRMLSLANKTGHLAALDVTQTFTNEFVSAR